MGVLHARDKELTNAETPLPRAERMEKALKAAFSPTEFTLVDQSSLHAGHAGAHPGGETHYAVRIVSAGFTGLSRIQRQRVMQACLRAEFDSGLHALTAELMTPDEAAARA